MGTGSWRVPLRCVLLFAAGYAVFAALDLLWAGLVNHARYVQAFGSLLRERPEPAGALMLYALILTGLIVFVYHPAIDDPRPWPLLGKAALFGTIAYSSFDLYAVSVFNSFTWGIVVSDIAWGAFLCAVTTAWLMLVQKVFLPVRRRPTQDHGPLG